MVDAAKYPNALGKFIARSGLRPAELARRAGTSRQQIHSLAIGERELTKAWAVRLAPHLNVTWAELLGDGPPGLSDASASFDGPRAADESDRLPEVAELLAAKFAEDNMTIGVRRITLHAIEALRQASSMDRRLPFEERARLAIEAKAADLARRLG